MGKNKHKNKSKPPTADKDLSEADAAAGKMVAERKDDEEKPMKRSREEEKPLTRKQKRQKLHEKNKWPQHPKITNSEQREKAYLRVAGIEAVSEEQEAETKFPGLSKDEKKALEEDDGDEWRHFGRFLGGTDARNRHKAVKRLGQFLKAKSGFGLNGSELDDVAGLSELDLLKLWKGLWYTLYMADKVPVQDELAKHIAKLMWCVAGDQETDEFAAQAYLDMEAQEEMELEEQQLAEGEGGDDDEDDDEDVKILSTRVVEMEDSDEEDDSQSEGDEEVEGEEDYEATPHIRGAPLAMLMMRTFFRTLIREWGNMDKYRVDKFYTLVRYMVREIYRYMAQRQWSLGIIKLFNDAITEEALMKPPNGVRYHLIDIALEELVLVATKEGVVPLTEAIFLELLEPYFTMAQHGFGDKTVQARVVEKVLEKFLLEFSVCSESEDDEQKVLKEVHVGTVSSFLFEMASTEETLGIHRKSLYDMHKLYERQMKKTGTDIKLGTAFQKSSEEEDDDDYATEDMEAEGEKEEETLEQMGFEAEEDDEKEEAETKESKKDKKKKKKKKKKGGKEVEEEEVSEEVVETPPKTKADKKKAKKNKSASKADMDTTQHGDGDGNTSNKKKKKKKHQKEDSDDDDDDVVTISKAEQKKAKQALEDKEEPANVDDEESDNEKSKKKKKKKKKDKKEEDEKKKKKAMKRRVSFDNHNRARSWKASMTGLRHLDPKEAISKTPEKSILLKKGISRSHSPKSRKKATDYF